MSDNQPSALAPTTSPLVEADPNSINEFITNRVNAIFNKKPPFTDEEITVMIEYWQRDRLRFKAESEAKEAKVKTPRPRTKISTPKEPIVAEGVIISNASLI